MRNHAYEPTRHATDDAQGRPGPNDRRRAEKNPDRVPGSRKRRTALWAGAGLVLAVVLLSTGLVPHPWAPGEPASALGSAQPAVAGPARSALLQSSLESLVTTAGSPGRWPRSWTPTVG